MKLIHKKSTRIKKSVGEWIFDIFNIVFFAALTFSFIYPFINILVVSLNDPYDAMRGGIYFWPREFSADNYKTVLADPQIYTSYGITIARTVIEPFPSFFAQVFLHTECQESSLCLKNGTQYFVLYRCSSEADLYQHSFFTGRLA